LGATLELSITPNSGYKGRGKRAVTAMGIVSVIHQIAIKKAIAAILCASIFIPFGVGKNKIEKKRNIPKKSPIACLLEYFLELFIRFKICRGSITSQLNSYLLLN